MRKTFTTLLLALVAGMVFGPVMAGTGGPDIYGYSWIDSDEPGGPVYAWNDITARAGAVQIMGLTDDNAVGPFNIGFNFQYYWISVDEFKFGSNGWIGLGPQGNIGNIAHCFPIIPTQGDGNDNFVAPFMTDLIFESNSPTAPNLGEAWYWSNNTDSLIIQYDNVSWWQQGTPNWIGSNTFQVIFAASDSSITFVYNDMDQANFNDVTQCDQDLTIGIENVTGNIGLSHSAETVPNDNYVIKFNYPATVTFQVPDATPAWIANSDNAGQIFVSNSSVTLDANIANVGNADILSDITVDGQLQSLSFATVWTDQTIISGGLTSGTDQTITFPTLVNLNTPGQFYLNVSTSNADDINQSNNDGQVEVSVVECVNDTFTMTYATGNPPDGVVAWAGGGGNDGAAVFFDAPGYPVTINSVDLFLLGDDQDPQTPMVSGCYVKIYDGTGAPGVLLDSVYVSPSVILEDQWNTISLNTPVTIAGDGFFVSWIMAGDSISLGTEAFGPISRRTYEVLNNNWAPYRQLSAEDFLVRANATGCGAFVAVDAPEANFTLETYPNPANEAFKVRFDLPNSGLAQFTLMDMMGQTVFRRDAEVNGGTTTFTYNSTELATGTYFLNMQFDGQKVTRKVIVSH